MSGASPLRIVRRHRLRLGHLWLELSRSECGATMWALCPPDPEDVDHGPCRPPVASGFVDDAFPEALRAAARDAENLNAVEVS